MAPVEEAHIMIMGLQLQACVHVVDHPKLEHRKHMFMFTTACFWTESSVSESVVYHFLIRPMTKSIDVICVNLICLV